MSGVGKRKWSAEATLVIPDPNVQPIDLDLIDVSEVSDGFFFEVNTAEMSVRELYQFNEFVSRLCDCDVMVTHVGREWCTICVLSSDKDRVRNSMEDAKLFFRNNITWEEHPREP